LVAPRGEKAVIGNRGQRLIGGDGSDRLGAEGGKKMSVRLFQGGVTGGSIGRGKKRGGVGGGEEDGG